jgi:heat shock protein HtpX
MCHTSLADIRSIKTIMSPLSTYTSSDWRKTKRINNRKTYLVIGIFFLIYFFLGMLVDVYIYSGQYQSASLSNIFTSLMTFKLFPLVTLIMLAIASISIFVTFALHDQLMLLGTQYREITSNSSNSSSETQLYNVIEEMKIAAGLQYMPKVYVIEAEYMNAFASGYSEKSAMVAITRGLMEKLNRSELQAVMAHELSHIRHNDIKLTLMASVLANLMIMVLDIFFYNVIFSRRNNDERRNGLMAIIILLRYLLPVINILLLLYLSRTREYMADAGSVELMRDNQPLASALLKINNDHTTHHEAYNAAYQQTAHENVRREAYIFDPTQAGISPMSSLADAFSTHPNLKDRLAALGFKYNE